MLRQLRSDDVVVSATGSRRPVLGGETGVVMAGPPRVGHPFWDPSNTGWPPNLLGGSPRTTAPGCIRPSPVVPGQHSSRVLDDNISPGSQITGTSTSVEQLEQHPECQSCCTDATTRIVTESKRPDIYCLGGQSILSTEATKHETERVEHDKFLSGTAIIVSLSSISATKQNNTGDCHERQSPPFDPTPSSRSQTLPSDVRGLQSFQIRTSNSPNIADVVQQPLHGVARFLSRMSLKSLRRFVATTGGFRRRSAASSTNSSLCSDCQPASASAGCSAPSNESSSSSAAAQSPLRFWFQRIRRRDVPQYTSGNGIITTKDSVTKSQSSTAVPLTTVVERHVSTDVTSCVTQYRETEVTNDHNQRRQTIDTSGTVDGSGVRNIVERRSQSIGVLRLSQPPTSLDLPAVPRGLTKSPGHYRVRHRHSLLSFESTESIGQCSVDVLASTDVG